MLQSILRIWVGSFYFWNKNWYFENFFFLKKDILKVLLTHVNIPHYGFLVQTPAQLRFGRERVMVFLETKMSFNSNTVTASVGT